jgi:hypothetical protein
MLDASVLYEKTAAAILSGKLPARRSDWTWGGPGTGAPCAVWHEFEMQVAGVENPRLTLHMHIRCFAVWN